MLKPASVQYIHEHISVYRLRALIICNALTHVYICKEKWVEKTMGV